MMTIVRAKGKAYCERLLFLPPFVSIRSLSKVTLRPPTAHYSRVFRSDNLSIISISFSVYSTSATSSSSSSPPSLVPVRLSCIYIYIYKLVYYNDVTTTTFYNIIIILYIIIIYNTIIIIIIAQHAVYPYRRIVHVYALNRMIFFFAAIDVCRLHGYIAGCVGLKF